jgi:hypothetical protein
MQAASERAIALQLLKATVAGSIRRMAVGQMVPRSAGAYRERSPDLVIAGPILSTSLLGQRSFGRLSPRNHCSRTAAKLIF